MRCPRCESERVQKNGVRQLKSGDKVQYYHCKDCNKRFNERAGTPMHRMQTSAQTIATVLRARGEGLGLRAAGRVFGNSHSSVMRWEARLAEHQEAWSPSPSPETELTVEGDELYTKVERNRPAHESEG